MEIIDLQKKKDESVIVTARIPKKYKDFIKKHNISVSMLICKSIDELE